MILEIVSVVGSVGSVGTMVGLSYHRMHSQMSRELHTLERQRADLERRLADKTPYPGFQTYTRASEPLRAVEDTSWMDIVGIPLDLWMGIKTEEDLEILKARRDAGGFKPKVFPPHFDLAPPVPTEPQILRVDDRYVHGQTKDGVGWRVPRRPYIFPTLHGDIEIATERTTAGHKHEWIKLSQYEYWCRGCRDALATTAPVETVGEHPVIELANKALAELDEKERWAEARRHHEQLAELRAEKAKLTWERQRQSDIAEGIRLGQQRVVEPPRPKPVPPTVEKGEVDKMRAEVEALQRAIAYNAEVLRKLGIPVPKEKPS